MTTETCLFVSTIIIDSYINERISQLLIIFFSFLTLFKIALN